MKKISQIILSVVLVSVAAFGLTLIPDVVNAADCTGAACARPNVTTGNGDIKDILQTVVNLLLFIVGTVSVIMVVIGGLKYTTSNGDSNRVTAAKNTILYAVVGVIVSIMGYAIVDFVIDSFVK